MLQVVPGLSAATIVKTLNEQGVNDILVVENGVKFRNIADCDIADYMDKEDFIDRVRAGESFADKIEAVFHEGACSSTTEWDGRFIMRNNYEYSKQLLLYCLARGIAYLYASSASVYGSGSVFREKREYEEPLNMYGYSKFLFDQYMRRLLPGAGSQIVGFRYFNVYGPREQHKGSMSSVAFHVNNQLHDTVNLSTMWRRPCSTGMAGASWNISPSPVTCKDATRVSPKRISAPCGPPVMTRRSRPSRRLGCTWTGCTGDTFSA